MKFVLIIGLLAAHTGFAQQQQEEFFAYRSKIYACETACELDKFGQASAVDGKTAVVGTQGANIVYVISEQDGGKGGSEWTIQHEISAPDSYTGDEFGHSLAIDGDYIVIGAPDDNYHDGAVFVYKYEAKSSSSASSSADDNRADIFTWEFHDKILSPDANFASSSFGYSVAINDGTIVVGAPYENEDTGAVYVFSLDRHTQSWGNIDKYTASDSATGDLFGYNVDFDGTTTVVGAIGSSTGDYANSGAVYVYLYRGLCPSPWTCASAGSILLEQRLDNPDLQNTDNFGTHVAVLDEKVVSTSIDKGRYARNDGVVHTFVGNTNDGWEFHQTITPEDETDELFENLSSISLTNNLLLVGASGHGTSGDAHLYEWVDTIWVYDVKFIPVDMQFERIGFGSSVAIGTDTLFIGANDEAFGSSDEDVCGSMYVYEKDIVSAVPSSTPSSIPSSSPSSSPSFTPSSSPSAQPSASPVPSSTPSTMPSSTPSTAPSDLPSFTPTAVPSLLPSVSPSSSPSMSPTVSPIPSAAPSVMPSSRPSSKPSFSPSSLPSSSPSMRPSLSSIPSSQPSTAPSAFPSVLPSSSPSLRPSVSPTAAPSTSPSAMPSMTPSSNPTPEPIQIELTASFSVDWSPFRALRRGRRLENEMYTIEYNGIDPQYSQYVNLLPDVGFVVNLPLNLKSMEVKMQHELSAGYIRVKLYNTDSQVSRINLDSTDTNYAQERTKYYDDSTINSIIFKIGNLIQMDAKSLDQYGFVLPLT